MKTPIERPMWAWKWQGARSIDPTTIHYTKKAVNGIVTLRCRMAEDPMGKIVRVFVREQQER